MVQCTRIRVPANSLLGFSLRPTFRSMTSAATRPRSNCYVLKLELGRFSRTRASFSSISIAKSCDEQNYNWIDGAECLDKYSPGGYHPVMLGDKLHGRYRILDKLGFGGYSTVWLAQDAHLDRYVAIKVCIADAPSFESHVLKVLSSSSPHPGQKSIPLPLDEFKVQGPNGTHTCYTMVPARCNLREVSYSRLFPFEVARALSGRLTLAIAYIHFRGYVHGDVHLRNVLVKLPSNFDHLTVEQLFEQYGKPETVTITRCDDKPLPPNIPAKAVIPLYLGKPAEEFTLSDTHIFLSDFGEAFMPMDCRLGKDSHTPLATRPPEARFEPDAPLSYSADIWSLATAIWDILGMKAIFSSEFAPADEVICQHIDTLGPMPLSWWHKWEQRLRYFNEDGHPKENRQVSPRIDEAFEDWVQKYRRKSTRVEEFDKEETMAILDLMRMMLAFRPEERPTVEEVLKSEWMAKWVLPSLDINMDIK